VLLDRRFTASRCDPPPDSLVNFQYLFHFLFSQPEMYHLAFTAKLSKYKAYVLDSTRLVSSQFREVAGSVCVTKSNESIITSVVRNHC
jgi:hypothetical protein